MTSIILTPSLSLFFRNLSFTFSIALVSKNYEGERISILDSALINKLVFPVLNLIKALILGTNDYLWACDIVNNDAAVWTAVESGSDTLEALLTSCVPYLKGVRLTVVGYSFWNEVSPNSCSVLSVKFSWDISLHQRSLSYAKELDLWPLGWR